MRTTKHLQALRRSNSPGFVEVIYKMSNGGIVGTGYNFSGTTFEYLALKKGMCGGPNPICLHGAAKYVCVSSLRNELFPRVKAWLGWPG